MQSSYQNDKNENISINSLIPVASKSRESGMKKIDNLRPQMKENKGQ